MHACYEEILEAKKRSLSLQTAALDFLKSTSGTCESPPVLLDTANEYPDDLPMSLLTYSFVIISYFFYILQMYDCTFFRRVRKIAKSDYWLRHIRQSAWNNSATRLPLDEFS